MSKLIDLMQDPVRTLLPVLLRDKTTGRNIIWATDSYADLGSGFSDKEQIDCGILLRHTDLIKPRVEKSKEDQAARTRKKAEVFTPTWLCNAMNNYCDEDWFGRKDVFNVEQPDHTWTATEDAVWFPKRKTWKQYVDSRRLEITCGEAPFLVSRYDASTGDIIVPPNRRIGLLDRKLRIVNENAKSPDEWVTWAFRAVESCYGYEYQGDNLLLARVNVLLTFLDYYRECMEKDPDAALLRKLAGRIAWNLWQMDGLKDTVPLGRLYEPYHQMSFFDLFPDKTEEQDEEPEAVPCRIYDWRRKNSLVFQSVKEYTDMGKKKLFTYVLGNPPYNEDFGNSGENGNFAKPVYNDFMDAARDVSEKVELIHPARFLFNAGSTPEDWNKKMLNDPHFKVLKYDSDSTKFFPNVAPIRGGIAVSYSDNMKDFGAIGIFSEFPEMIDIMRKCHAENESASLASIVYRQTKFDLDVLYDDFPELRNVIGSNGRDKRFRNNAFTKMDGVFLESAKNPDDVKVLGLIKNKRVWRYISKKYVDASQENLSKWKVLCPAANGAGQFGELLSNLVVNGPGTGYTQTFIGIGAFGSNNEAMAAEKYLKTKFARALLDVLKVTQHNDQPVWKLIPLQDFTSSSDIDWSQSVPEIDRQLYRKYGFTADEIDFIETHVKEMV